MISKFSVIKLYHKHLIPYFFKKMLVENLFIPDKSLR